MLNIASFRFTIHCVGVTAAPTDSPPPLYFLLLLMMKKDWLSIEMENAKI